ncbi:uncharacterized protein LOC136040170 isoform X2 [Artemia franciscana]|uniref:Uncharacterized protein n=1 Tax=Artemia franciscana TaxID=6661 RepID=A0AA88HQJ4_ARTSF|nr:hypothetical protein QYM36_009061 [Artemia franciscana]KAK2714708.1 hypothetical protein QYM36_009061 [Artemia franciscana]KAK2714709.1 hypothetical protein QYM36_009061 [Artemia franciscana]KAK2714710.1 hypothetical protein QYM36_009061 [Artemia franciscana]KAK2714711.1 hypothetical protein QYM36_009061 [Artemia franciscana]
MSLLWSRRLPREKELEEAFATTKLSGLKHWSKPENIPIVTSKDPQPAVLPDRIVMGGPISGFMVFFGDKDAWRVQPPEGKLPEMFKNLHLVRDHMGVNEMYHNVKSFVHAPRVHQILKESVKECVCNAWKEECLRKRRLPSRRKGKGAKAAHNLPSTLPSVAMHPQGRQVLPNPPCLMGILTSSSPRLMDDQRTICNNFQERQTSPNRPSSSPHLNKTQQWSLSSRDRAKSSHNLSLPHPRRPLVSNGMPLVWQGGNFSQTIHTKASPRDESSSRGRVQCWEQLTPRTAFNPASNILRPHCFSTNNTLSRSHPYLSSIQSQGNTVRMAEVMRPATDIKYQDFLNQFSAQPSENTFLNNFEDCHKKGTAGIGNIFSMNEEMAPNMRLGRKAGLLPHPAGLISYRGRRY